METKDDDVLPAMNAVPDGVAAPPQLGVGEVKAAQGDDLKARLRKATALFAKERYGYEGELPEFEHWESEGGDSYMVCLKAPIHVGEKDVMLALEVSKDSLQELKSTVLSVAGEG